MQAVDFKDPYNMLDLVFQEKRNLLVILEGITYYIS